VTGGPAPRRLRILDEETVRRAPPPGADPDAINPYWLDEEPPEHPDPEAGCIRRGYCCRAHPGWFAPGEVERAAAALGLEPDAFVRRYAVVVEVEVDGRTAQAFAPVKLGRDGEPLIPPASRADRLYYALRSPCVFYTGEGCRIYAARPYECRRYVCTNPPEANPTHAGIGRMWLEGAAPDPDPAPDPETGGVP